MLNSCIVTRNKHAKQTDALFLRYLRMRDSVCCICGKILQGRQSKIIYIKDSTNLNVRYNEHFCALMCTECAYFSKEIIKMFKGIPVKKNKFLKPEEKEPEYLGIMQIDGRWFRKKRGEIKKQITDLALWYVWLHESGDLTEQEKLNILSKKGLL